MLQEVVITKERRLSDHAVILNLACGHNIHTSPLELGNRIRTNSLVWPCHHCPREILFPSVSTKEAQHEEATMSNHVDLSLKTTKPFFTRRRTCYYAHCMSLYDTAQEARDVETLRSMGFDVVNPNTTEIAARAKSMRDGYAESPSGQYTDGSAYVMYELFKPMAETNDVLAFRALPDGSIPSGVAKEIQWATRAGKTILELPSGLRRRTLTVELTREYLAEAGQR